jgi:hypothetical protein
MNCLSNLGVSVNAPQISPSRHGAAYRSLDIACIAARVLAGAEASWATFGEFFSAMQIAFRFAKAKSQRLWHH